MLFNMWFFTLNILPTSSTFEFHKWVFVACFSAFGLITFHCLWLIFAVKLAIGGFSMGAATALHSATCFALGKYGNGNPYPLNLSAVVGLSGWLPDAGFVLSCWAMNSSYYHDRSIYWTYPLLSHYYIFRSLKSKLESSQEAARRASSLPILLCHGKGTYLELVILILCCLSSNLY